MIYGFYRKMLLLLSKKCFFHRKLLVLLSKNMFFFRGTYWICFVKNIFPRKILDLPVAKDAIVADDSEAVL